MHISACFRNQLMDITSAAFFGIIVFLSVGNMRILPVAFDIVILSVVLAGVKKAGNFGTSFQIHASSSLIYSFNRYNYREIIISSFKVACNSVHFPR